MGMGMSDRPPPPPPRPTGQPDRQGAPSPPPPVTADLPDGVRLVPLAMNRDPRGTFTELFRASWAADWRAGGPFVQWNAVHSGAAVLRGVHVHPGHADYLVLISGEMVLGLHDMRCDAPTRGASRLITLTGDTLTGVVIPPGVAHGFAFLRPSLHIYAVNAYWNPASEFGCRWNAPELGLAWPVSEPLLSDRDRALGDYAGVLAALDATPVAE